MFNDQAYQNAVLSRSERRTKEQPMSDTLQEREDQMTTTNTNTHQNPTVWHDCCKGYDHAPWCFEAVKVPGVVTAAISDSDSAPQPAARGGGEWTLSKPLTNQILSDDFHRGSIGAMPIHGIDIPEDSSDRIHFAAVVVFGGEERARKIIDAVNQHQALVAERESYAQLLTAAKSLIAMNNCNYGRSAMRERGGFIELEKAVDAIEQRSTSE